MRLLVVDSRDYAHGFYVGIVIEHGLDLRGGIHHFFLVLESKKLVLQAVEFFFRLVPLFLHILPVLPGQGHAGFFRETPVFINIIIGHFRGKLRVLCFHGDFDNLALAYLYFNNILKFINQYNAGFISIPAEKLLAEFINHLVGNLGAV